MKFLVFINRVFINRESTSECVVEAPSRNILDKFIENEKERNFSYWDFNQEDNDISISDVADSGVADMTIGPNGYEIHKNGVEMTKEQMYGES